MVPSAASGHGVRRVKSPLSKQINHGTQAHGPLETATSIVFAFALLVFATVAINIATDEGVLIPSAFPFGISLILAARFGPLVSSRFLGRRAEKYAWLALSAWLGLTYFPYGNRALEILALCLYVGCALLSARRFSYLLGSLWLAHPLWDFVPRTLPNFLTDLPRACILFDVPIGCYLIHCARTERFSSPEVRSPITDPHEAQTGLL
jgi:hypothetical protein